MLAGLAAEFLCLGLLAGVLAAFAATAVEAALAKYIFNLDVVINTQVWLIAPPLCALVVTACGLLGTRPALRAPPVTVLQRA